MMAERRAAQRQQLSRLCVREKDSHREFITVVNLLLFYLRHTTSDELVRPHVGTPRHVRVSYTSRRKTQE